MQCGDYQHSVIIVSVSSGPLQTASLWVRLSMYLMASRMMSSWVTFSFMQRLGSSWCSLECNNTQHQTGLSLSIFTCPVQISLWEPPPRSSCLWQRTLWPPHSPDCLYLRARPSWGCELWAVWRPGLDWGESWVFVLLYRHQSQPGHTSQ